jgi:hypothetical protein
VRYDLEAPGAHILLVFSPSRSSQSNYSGYGESTFEALTNFLRKAAQQEVALRIIEHFTHRRAHVPLLYVFDA